MNRIIKIVTILGSILLAAPSYGYEWSEKVDDLIVSEPTYTVVKVTGPQAVTIAFECNCRWFIDERAKTLFLLELPKDICI